MREIVPEGWARCEIGDVARVISGGTPPSKDSTNFTTEGGIPWITPADLSGYKNIYIDKGARNLTDKGFSSCSARKIPPGSVLFSSRAPVGYVAIAQNEVTTNQGFKSFALPIQLDSRFVYFYLCHIRPIAEAMATGTTFKELSGAVAARLPLAVAPFNEQVRIADKLDALLTRVDACRERLDLVPHILKQFRQAVLAAATSGKLTEDWRAIRSDWVVERRKSMVSPEGTPSHCPTPAWRDATIGELLEAKPRNGYSPRAVEYETHTKSLTLTATTSGRFMSEYFKYINEEIPKDSYLWLQPDDILIQRANTIEYVGVSAIYDGPSFAYIYPDLMMKCRANSEVLTKFLHYLLQSEGVRAYYRANATGTAGNMPKISQGTVMAAPVCVPPVEEQHEIVIRVEPLLAFADRLESRLTTARKQVEHLTPALLAKAFRGELVPQDPNDEPASVLLERIRALRGAAVPDAGSRRRKGIGKSQKTISKEVVMLTRKDVQPNHLFTLLRERGPLIAKELWAASQLDIDDFYDQLKEEEALGFLREKRGGLSEETRLLEAIG